MGTWDLKKKQEQLDDVGRLAKTLRSAGFAMSESEAKRMAENMIATEKRITKEYAEQHSSTEVPKKEAAEEQPIKRDPLDIRIDAETEYAEEHTASGVNSVVEEESTATMIDIPTPQTEGLEIAKEVEEPKTEGDIKPLVLDQDESFEEPADEEITLDDVDKGESVPDLAMEEFTKVENEEIEPVAEDPAVEELTKEDSLEAPETSNDIPPELKEAAMEAPPEDDFLGSDATLSELMAEEESKAPAEETHAITEELSEPIPETPEEDIAMDIEEPSADDLLAEEFKDAPEKTTEVTDMPKTGDIDTSEEEKIDITDMFNFKKKG